MSVTNFRRTALVVAMCVGLVGCQVSTSPTQVARWDQRHALAMTHAARNGQYSLMEVQPDPKAPRKILREVHLKKDEPLGFRQQETGVVAVAGDLEIPVNSGQYEWEMQANKGQTDPAATTIFIVVTVLIVLVVIIVVAFEATSHTHETKDIVIYGL